MRTKSILCLLIAVLVISLGIPTVLVDEKQAEARDVRYPVYIKPGFSINRFRTLASKKGFPPSWVPLEKPPGATDVIPLCAIADYRTAEKSTVLSWRCTWDEEIKGPDMVQFELTAYGENWGWVEATAVLLDTAYFDLIPAGRLGDNEQLVPVIDLTLSSGESQTVTIDRSADAGVIPIMTVNVYETGGDEDFQFFIAEGQLFDADEDTTTVTLVAENGNADSYVEAHIYFIRPLVASAEWDLWTFAVENGMEINQPENSIIPFNTDEFNTMIFPSLVSYFPDGDSDFEVGNFVTVSGEEAAFQLEAQYGHDTSWAAWQHIVIHVPITE
jgi:hypothetical protein